MSSEEAEDDVQVPLTKNPEEWRKMTMSFLGEKRTEKKPPKPKPAVVPIGVEEEDEDDEDLDEAEEEAKLEVVGQQIQELRGKGKGGGKGMKGIGTKDKIRTAESMKIQVMRWTDFIVKDYDPYANWGQ